MNRSPGEARRNPGTTAPQAKTRIALRFIRATSSPTISTARWRCTGAAKTVVWQATWLPFGAASAITGTASLDARFPGRWFHIETGLNYNWHRHHDPTIRRYTQPDPLGFVDGPSVYASVSGNPLSYADQTGNCGVVCVIVVFAGVTAGEDLLSQLYKYHGNIHCVDWGEVGLAALLGAGLGGVAALPAELLAARGGVNFVYRSVDAAGRVNYVGITNNLARRAAEQLGSKGINIQELVSGMLRSDARAVEQALIETHGLTKNGGTLLNKINSIAKSNPTYAG